MTAYALQLPKFQAFNAVGAPLDGGKVYTYENGTTTNKTTYTDSGAGTPNANPVILDTRGEADIWLDGTYTIVLKDADDVQIYSVDDVTGIGSTSDVIDQWVLSGLTPTYVSATSFTFAGDQTSDFEVGRRIKTTNSGGTVYSTIVTSAYSDPNTTVTTVNDASASLDSGLSSVSLGILSSTSRAYPDMLIDPGVLCPHKNLVVKNNVTNPNYQIDIDADNLVLSDASGARVAVSSVNLTVDITGAGANGLDTGAEAVSTEYHVWVIMNTEGTVAGLLSTSATAPTMPAGYAFKGYVSSYYNLGSGHFQDQYQVNNVVSSISITLKSAGTDTTMTAITSATIASLAKRLNGYCGASIAAGTGVSITVGPSSTLRGHQVISMTNVTSGSISNYGQFSVSMFESQTIYYKVIASNLGYVYVTGWEF